MFFLRERKGSGKIRVCSSEIMDDDLQAKSTEETDQLQRSVKKFKRDEREGLESEASPTPVFGGPRAWSNLFHQQSTEKEEMYTGEGEDDDTVDDLLEKYDDSMVAGEDATGEGRKALEIPLEECKELWKPWRRALIIKVLGKSCSFKVLERRLGDLWANGGKLDIIDLDDGFYIVRFFSKIQYLLALNNGPWMVQGHYIAVKKWRPHFSTKHEEIASTLAWVRIPKLPVEYFDEHVLMKLGNLLGKAVRVDDTTMNVERGKYARLCVEIDLKKPLMSGVLLNGKLFDVEYEGLNSICFKCGRYGHSVMECESTGEQSRDAGGELTETRRDNLRTEPFGPWMIASNRRSRKNVGSRSDIGRVGGNTVTDMNGRTSQILDDSAQPRGKSRFYILDEAETDIPDEEDEEELQRQIGAIFDKGPVADIQLKTKKTASQRKKDKGFVVKEIPKAKINLQAYNKNTNPTENSHGGNTAGGLARGGSSSRGRGGSGRGAGRGSNQRSLRDITNSTSQQVSGTVEFDSFKDWPALNGDTNRVRQIQNGLHIKIHPPKEQRSSKDVGTIPPVPNITDPRPMGSDTVYVETNEPLGDTMEESAA